MNIQEKRIKLETNKQRELILKASKMTGSIKKLSLKINISYSTLKKYYQELFLLPENVFDKIIEITKTKKEELNIQYLPGNWGMIIGGKRGMETLQKKYPKEIIKWRKKRRKNLIPYNIKKIKYPQLNEKLSEFIGVYLGDGTLTKYFIRISGDVRYDIPYFEYLSKLTNDLFGLTAKIAKDKRSNTFYLTIFSKQMCSFLKEKYHLKFGNKIKNRAEIPNSIIENKKHLFACIRGLIDTDGAICRRGRKGSQFCIQFTSHNKYLLKQVKKIMQKEKIFTFDDKTGTGTNNKENIIKYFEVIGSSNLRHIIRFYLRFYENKTIYSKDVSDYYQKDFYKNINLPFKINNGPVS